MSEAQVIARLPSPAIQDGVEALLLAGRADRGRRRALVGAAARRIAAQLGHAPYYAIGGEPEAAGGDGRATAADATLEGWLAAALALMRSSDEPVARALFRSVLRPLAERLGAYGVDAGAASARIARAAADGEPSLAGLRTELARAAAAPAPALAVIEAAAALARLGPAVAIAAAAGPGGLRVAKDGPYLLTGEAEIADHLGVAIERRGPLALCRCGRSATKPFCDGSHAEADFSGDKDPRRVADRRDTYVGQQATIHDNRGLCAHSGFCTDRLDTVFHLGEEPFVTPSGGRLDDIIRAVRRCPSGALGFALGPGEDRHLVDPPRPLAIEVSKDGPYRVTGGIGLLDEAGAPVERPAGASLEHYSLCRCGASLNKPFCSGMHWSVGFADPWPDPAAEPTLFEWAGGYPALLDTTRLFYSRHVPADPLVGPLFATMAPDHPERVAAWLSEVFGGPKFYTERHGGYPRMVSQHLGKHLTGEQRAHWARLMVESADEAGLPDDPEFRAAFTAYIEWGSRIAVENSRPDAKPPANMPVPQWWWVCNAVPGARASALAMEAAPCDPPLPTLEEGERASFATHIKPLFRAGDRAAMRFAFDLGSFDDVARHADAIHARLRAGTMPCDGTWSPEKISLFARWIDDGKQP